MKSLKGSKTHENLMKAFAGESQARNRYIFYGQVAEEQGLPLVKKKFESLANQEQMHARIFFTTLAEDFNGTAIDIEADYPVDFYSNNTLENLLASVKAELHEHTEVYPAFSRIAKEEGYAQVATKFAQIAEIEESHAKILDKIAKDIENDTLFARVKEMNWECDACGYRTKAKKAPKKCPVCAADQGMFHIVH